MATPAAPAPLPNVTLSFGPMLIGVFVNMILYGVLISQTVTYFQTSKQDALWMRLFVAYLFFVETANTAMDMFMMYEPLIMNYGQKPVFFPTVFMTEPLVIVLVAFPIQLFFAWRITRLTGSWWISAIIALFGAASFAGGIWTTTEIQILREFAKKPLLHTPALVWFLSACVADVLITVTLVFTLNKKKTGFVATDSVLDKIIRTTIQTGMITAVFSILDVACFMALPHYAINFVWDLALSKLYSNCLLSTLNARRELNDSRHASSFRAQHARGAGMVTSPTLGNGKQGTFIESQNDIRSFAVYEHAQPGDAEYGVHMTKIVERIADPMPREDMKPAGFAV